METAPQKAIARNRPISGVILLGLFLVLGGFLIQDSMGGHLIITGLGAALLMSGIVYSATGGNGQVALANAVVSLVAVQLLAFSGVLRLLGGLAIVTVCLSIIASRL